VLLFSSVSSARQSVPRGGLLPAARRHLFEKRTNTPIALSLRATEDGWTGMQVPASNDLGAARAARAFL